MSFKKDNYVLIKNILSKDVVKLAHNYIMRKKKLYDFLIDKKITSPVTNYNYWGNSDPHIPEAYYSSYGDVLIDTLLEDLKPKIEKETGLELIENHTFTRIYKTLIELLVKYLEL